jgi:DNA-binding response OmpR family regulator
MSSDQSIPTVLIVDDDPVQTDLFRLSLERFGGFRVLTAANGKQGLLRAMEDLPNCMIIDMMMPELNGLQLIRLLRGDPATSSIPLIVLSALTQAEDQFQGLLAGADYYMTKPIPLQELLNAVKSVMERSRDQYQQQLEQLIEHL